MATYHLRLKAHSRKLQRVFAGGATRRSALAAAAYRSGEALYDHSLERRFEYFKPDVVHTEIILPEGVGAPEWMMDRERLWNAVERSEKRKDAQLFREAEISLPRELTLDQQIELVRSYVRDMFVSRGMVADCAIHCPSDVTGRPQPHAHIMLSLRRVDPKTETGFSLHKERDWNEPADIAEALIVARKRFNNTRLEQDREALDAVEAQRNVNVWREQWSVYANRALEAAGSDARIDHRTLEKQGIFRMPQIHLGIARHIENAYEYIKQRVTHWVSIRKRGELYADAERLAQRSPAELAGFILKIGEIAEAFTEKFRQPPKDKPEASHDR